MIGYSIPICEIGRMDCHTESSAWDFDTGTKRKPLGRLIGAFKTISTKEINQMRNTPSIPMWQGNYYEHIIRDKEALHNIRRYSQTTFKPILNPGTSINCILTTLPNGEPRSQA
jgi:hypothetical protein